VERKKEQERARDGREGGEGKDEGEGGYLDSDMHQRF
jgi:hypothetical protein